MAPSNAQEPHIMNVYGYNDPARPGDFDMVSLTAMYLEKGINPSAAAYFLNSPMIVDVKALNPNTQRLVINRFFKDALFRFRSVRSIPVTNAIPWLIDDGTHVDWTNLFTTYVLPFLKTHAVLDVLASANKG